MNKFVVFSALLLLCRAGIGAGAEINILSYGATAGLNCSSGSTALTTNTTDIQNALNAAATGNTLYIPSGTYAINSSIQKTSGTFSMNIRGDSVGTTLILWCGSSGTASVSMPVFYMLGWNNSSIRDLSILIPTASNVVGWDLDTNGTYQSSELLLFENVYVQEGAGNNNIGWRAGISSTGAGDLSYYTFVNTRCNASSGTSGTICWMPLRQDALNWVWINGGASSIANPFTETRLSTWSGSEKGGASMYFYGLANSLTSGTDFSLTDNGDYLISGGRFENGVRFLVAGDTGSAPVNVSVRDAMIAQYTGNVFGNIFTINGSVNLDLTSNSVIAQSTDYTNQMLSISASSGQVSNITVKNNTFSTAEPFYLVNGTGGTAGLHLQGNSRANESNAVTGLYQDVFAVFPAPTISQLATCTSGLAGSENYVTNGQSSPSYLGTVGTTGSTFARVMCNGTHWVYH